MTAADLLGPASPMGLPAPFGLIIFFKLLGFVLHLVPMGLWYAGIPIALILRLAGGDDARQLSDRLMKQMPVLTALGVNFGIVPLLFIQVAYPRVFYPATILMAWPWFSVFVLMTIAYYGIYIYAVGLKRSTLTPRKQAAGWVSAVLFVAIGFLFTNAMSLMTNVDGWVAIWKSTHVGGAPTGTALNTGDPTLWPRWLMAFGLAMMTTAAFTFVDAGWFGRRGTEAFLRWRGPFALRSYAAGALVFGATGAWYAYGTWSAPVAEEMLAGAYAWLGWGAALSPAAVLIALLALRSQATPLSGSVVAGLHLVVLTLNAVARQWVQDIELRPFFDVSARAVSTEWGSLTMFLLTFAAGLGVVGWMVMKALEAGERRLPITD